MNLIWRIIKTIFDMGWEIFWALALGFLISGVIQAVVKKGDMARILPDSGPRSIVIASLLGAASSSCSYAAVALSRSMFRKAADFIAVMAFQFASTNLVFELGIVLIVLMGWQFMLAEFAGGIIMIALMTVLLRLVMTPKLVEAAKHQAEQGRSGRMEGHAAMDMSVDEDGSLLHRALSRKGVTATSHYYFMDWASVWVDIAVGLAIAGIVDVLVPHQFWRALFLTHDPLAAKLIGPLIGPIVACLAFVCSVGNVPLAAVLWSGGISFGGVTSFLFADLLIVPIIDIYRKYYGWRVTLRLLPVFYVSMVLAGYAVEFAFDAIGLVPKHRAANVPMSGVGLNANTVLDVIFLILSAIMLRRFMTTGGPKMMAMMSGDGGSGHHAHQHG